MQIDVKTNIELYDVARLFYGEQIPQISFFEDDGKYRIIIEGKQYDQEYSSSVYSVIPREHRAGRIAKIAMYDALSAFCGQNMPWGALTGVRPSKLFYECLRSGRSIDESEECMRNVYRVSKKRAEVLKAIILSQSGKVRFSDEYYNLYVHIPYCTTRCSYCSFVSAPIGKNAEQSHEYVRLLSDEIIRSVALLHKHGKKILSVYIGGGTPTALDAADFSQLLSAIGRFDCEYTCEAGRPDTIDKRKIDLMKKHGVSRVCVNPQTLNEQTLAKIGRSHGVDDFYRVFKLVQEQGFDINCDLIAGLADETPSDFKKSFDGIRALSPQNITVHSLSKKNGSAIRYDDGENKSVGDMIDHVLNNLGEYRPYYLYRQKRQAGNLENVGLSLVGKECVNNITTMEETVSVMACGAGAISKIIDGNSIMRFANMRDIPLYISRYEEKLKAKLDCFAAHFD